MGGKIELVFQEIDGVVNNHSRSGVAHHFTDLCAHVFFVAMHGAAFASGFIVAKLAFVQSKMRIFKQSVAVSTK